MPDPPLVVPDEDDDEGTPQGDEDQSCGDSDVELGDAVEDDE